MADNELEQQDTPTSDPRENDEPQSDSRDDSNPQAAADTQEKSVASEPANAERMIGAREDNVDTSKFPRAYDQDETVNTATQKLTPEQQQLMSQRAAENDHLDHTTSKIARAAEAMAGGPHTSYTFDSATGELKQVKTPLTRGQIALGIIANILGGMGAGARAGGVDPRNGRAILAPGAAAGAGFAYGEKRVEDADKAAKDEAMDVWKRHVQTVQTNFQLHQNEVAQNKLGWDSSMEDIKLGAPLYKMLTDLDASGDYKDEKGQPLKFVQKIISGSDFQKEMASDPNWLATHSAIKVDQEWDIDPATGQPHKNPHGDSAINMKYAIIDKKALDAKVNIPEEYKKYIKGNIPADWKVRVGFLNDLRVKAASAQTNKHFADQFGGKEKDTTSDRAEAAKTGENKPFEAVRNDPNASIWARYPNLSQLADVMEKFESGGKPDAVSVRNNNPGNITNPDGTFKKFATPEEGKAAQVALLDRLKSKYPDLTAKDLIDGGKGYAGYSSSKAPGNTPESVKNYVSVINDGVPTAGFSGAAPSTLPKGLDWAAPDVSDLSDSASSALKRLGGFNAFRIYPGESKSRAQAEVDSKKISSEDYADILNRMQSKDEKLQGADAVAEDKQRMLVAADVRKKTAEAGVAVDKKQMEEDTHKKTFIKNNEPLIKSIGEGGMFDVNKIVGMRTQDRDILYNEIESRYSNWKNADVEAKVELFKDAAGAKKMTTGSYANSISVANTSLGHIAGAIGSIEELKSKYPNDFSDTSMKSNTLQWFNKKFGNEPAWNRYRVALETGITDWQNLLNNQHALTDVVRKQTDEYMSPTAPLINSTEGLKEMAHTAAVRIKPLAETWKQTMGSDHPNLIQNETLGAIRKINNPEVSRILGEMHTGGTLTGSSDGKGQGGSKVADWVAPLKQGEIRIKDSQGNPHDILRENLDEAKKRDPKLQVVFEK